MCPFKATMSSYHGLNFPTLRLRCSSPFMTFIVDVIAEKKSSDLSSRSELGIGF